MKMNDDEKMKKNTDNRTLTFVSSRGWMGERQREGGGVEGALCKEDGASVGSERCVCAGGVRNDCRCSDKSIWLNFYLGTKDATWDS